MDNVWEFLDKWDLILFTVMAMWILAYDLYKRVDGKESASPKSYLVLILIGMGVGSIHTAREHWRQTSESGGVVLDHVRDRLMEKFANNNPYLETKLEDEITELKSLLVTEKFDTRSRVDELTRAMKVAQEGDIIKAIDYGIDWGGNFQDYELENERAAKRGVRITRIFILPSDNWEASKREAIQKSLIVGIEKQSGMGISVKFAPEKTLEKHCRFNMYREGFVLFKYRQGPHVLMHEPVPLPKQENTSRYFLTITSMASEIGPRDQMFDCLIAKNDLVKDYSPTEGKIYDLVAAADQTK